MFALFGIDNENRWYPHHWSDDFSAVLKFARNNYQHWSIARYGVELASSKDYWSVMLSAKVMPFRNIAQAG